MNIIRRIVQAECRYQRRRLMNILIGMVCLSQTDWG